jgi:hypothetical protein
MALFGTFWHFLAPGFRRAPREHSYFGVPCAPPRDGGDHPKLYLFFTFSLPKNFTISLPYFTVFPADPEGQAGLASGEMTPDDQTLPKMTGI